MKKQVFVMLAALFVFVALFAPGVHAADNVYAILYEDGTLVFQYGNTPETGRTVKETYPVDLTADYVYLNGTPSTPWYNERESIQYVSFADKVSPTSTANYFNGCYNLKRVDNIQNLDTTNVTDMRCMFWGCNRLTALDLSHFDTAKVTNMPAMFYGCTILKTLDLSHFDTSSCDDAYSFVDMFSYCNHLKTIYVSEKFEIKPTEHSDQIRMFDSTGMIVGGNGTRYGSSGAYDSYSLKYARIDNPPDAPGYFTDASTVYAITYAAPNNGNLSVALLNPAAVTVAVSCFDANGQFVSAPVQSVQANAGTVTLPLSAGTRKACVMLFDSDYRPMCAPFAAVV